MRRKKMMRILRQSFRVAGADKIFYTYFGIFFVTALLLRFVEPEIETLPDSLWYCFAVATTVGFGDIAAGSTLGRILTAILSVYSIAVVAIFTAVITSFFMDVAKTRAEDSAKEFIDELERLPELSKEELENLSERVKHFRSDLR